jgi:hypothetical protein
MRPSGLCRIYVGLARSAIGVKDPAGRNNAEKQRNIGPQVGVFIRVNE